MLLAPSSILELVRSLWGMTASFVRMGDSDWYVRGYLEVVLSKESENLAYMGNCTLVLESLIRQGLSSNYWDRRQGTNVTLLRHDVKV